MSNQNACGQCAFADVEPVYADIDGYVSSEQWRDGTWSLVVYRLNGPPVETESRIDGLTYILVGAGDPIRPGDLIGLKGTIKRQDVGDGQTRR